MFLNYIHTFRGIAILLIVAGHSMSAFDWTNKQVMARFLQILLQNGSVFFVFISGFLFQHLSYKYNFKAYMKRKLKNIILPYLICSIPAIIFFTFIVHRPNIDQSFYANSIPLQIILFYLTGSHLAPYWFIPMIAIFYIISPLLIVFDKNRILYYLLPIFIIVSLIVQRGTVIQSFVHFFPVYVFGMLFSKYKEILIPLTGKYLKLLLGLFVLLLILECNFYTQRMLINFLGKIVGCFFILPIVYQYDALLKEKFSYLASVSFGIFFVHNYVISSFKLLSPGKIGGNFVLLPSVLNFLLFFVAMIIVCILLIILAKKTFGKHSRSIIGC